MTKTAARRTGEVAYWNAEKGFGFIAASSGERVFFHATHMARAGRGAVHPAVGDAVTFGIGTDSDGRTSAREVAIAGEVAASPVQSRPPARREEPRNRDRLVFATVLASLVIAAALLGRVPVWLPAVYVGVGLGSFLAYLEDKRRAGSQQWRLTEISLHALDLAGGIIGGLAAQFALRHKTRKVTFGTVTFAVATIHLLWLSGLTLGAVSWSEFADLPRRLATLMSG